MDKDHLNMIVVLYWMGNYLSCLFGSVIFQVMIFEYDQLVFHSPNL